MIRILALSCLIATGFSACNFVKLANNDLFAPNGACQADTTVALTTGPSYKTVCDSATTATVTTYSDQACQTMTGSVQYTHSVASNVVMCGGEMCYAEFLFYPTTDGNCGTPAGALKSVFPLEQCFSLGGVFNAKLYCSETGGGLYQIYSAADCSGSYTAIGKLSKDGGAPGSCTNLSPGSTPNGLIAITNCTGPVVTSAPTGTPTTSAPTTKPTDAPTTSSCNRVKVGNIPYPTNNMCASQGFTALEGSVGGMAKVTCPFPTTGSISYFSTTGNTINCQTIGNINPLTDGSGGNTVSCGGIDCSIVLNFYRSNDTTCATTASPVSYAGDMCYTQGTDGAKLKFQCNADGSARIDYYSDDLCTMMIPYTSRSISNTTCSWWPNNGNFKTVSCGVPASPSPAAAPAPGGTDCNFFVQRLGTPDTFPDMYHPVDVCDEGRFGISRFQNFDARAKCMPDGSLLVEEFAHKTACVAPALKSWTHTQTSLDGRYAYYCGGIDCSLRVDSSWTSPEDYASCVMDSTNANLGWAVPQASTPGLCGAEHTEVAYFGCMANNKVLQTYTGCGTLTNSSMLYRAPMEKVAIRTADVCYQVRQNQYMKVGVNAAGACKGSAGSVVAPTYEDDSNCNWWENIANGGNFKKIEAIGACSTFESSVGQPGSGQTASLAAVAVCKDKDTLTIATFDTGKCIAPTSAVKQPAGINTVTDYKQGGALKFKCDGVPCHLTVGKSNCGDTGSVAIIRNQIPGICIFPAGQDTGMWHCSANGHVWVQTYYNSASFSESTAPTCDATKAQWMEKFKLTSCETCTVGLGATYYTLTAPASDAFMIQSRMVMAFLVVVIAFV